jgi:rhodanese-related sulfurtransferase
MSWMIALLLAGLLVAICFVTVLRRREKQRISTSHIDVGELNARMQQGEHLTIVDLRHPLDVLASPQVIPGAIHIDPAQVEQKATVISRDADLVLYCTCPNEETSMKVLRQLQKRGFRHVRALTGGLPKWKSAGLAVQEIYPELRDQIRSQHTVS